MIRDLAVTDEGGVTFTFLLAPEDPATLVRQARAAVQAIDGVRRDEMKINVTNPAGPGQGHPRPPGRSRAPAGPPPTPAEQPNLGQDRRDLVGQGRGGQVHRRRQPRRGPDARPGFSVGLMDADVYGPNIPRMFGVFDRPPVVAARSSRSRPTA